MKTTIVAAACALPALFSGCAIGPATVPRDRFDYSAAIADSSKSQMLLGLVKIRYNDAPVFLDVGQVVAGYSIGGNVTAGANIPLLGGTPPNNPLTLGATGTFTQNPTITYAPMKGDQFAHAMMDPISPAVVLSNIESGHPAEYVFRLAVQGINGIHNRRVFGDRVQPADPNFYHLLSLLRRLQESGNLGMQVQGSGKDVKLALVIRSKLPAASETDWQDVARLLGLDPNAREFHVVYARVAANNKEIALLTRSMLAILTDLAAGVSVPSDHLTDGRATPMPEVEYGPQGPIKALIRIEASTVMPSDAFVAVPYQGYWFFIDNRDAPSKRIFSALMLLFTFVETSGTGPQTVLTIPTR